MYARHSDGSRPKKGALSCCNKYAIDRASMAVTSSSIIGNLAVHTINCGCECVDFKGDYTRRSKIVIEDKNKM